MPARLWKTGTGVARLCHGVRVTDVSDRTELGLGPATTARSNSSRAAGVSPRPARTGRAAVSSWMRAFADAAAFPAAERGPVDFWAFRRFAFSLRCNGDTLR